MKKIYVSYNVFDNEELLEQSIKNIRNFVSHISIVFQKVSNRGNNCDPNLENFLLSLKDKKLVDSLILYNPNLKASAEANELNKNNIGYALSKKSGCDYYMGMACDEFYFEEEFKKILDTLEEYPVDLVTGYMYTYYKTTNYRFKEIENYVVPIMNKIYDDDRKFIINHPSPLLIDPTRRMKYDSCFCLPKSKPIMHHLSHVRKDYAKKLLNSSANINWYDKINEAIKHYQNWKPGDDANIYGKLEKLEFTDRFKEEIIF
jgi:hypothetical protein